MSQPFVGEIRILGFNFAPAGWAFCNGALSPIDQNPTLFTLIGTTYGGDGVQTFGLPDLQGRLAVHQGTSQAGLTWVIGEVTGELNHTLIIGEVPSHTHQANAGDGVAFAAQTAAPSSTSYFGRERGGAWAATSNTTMAANAISANSGNQPHSNTMPTLTMNYSISLFGIFPSQN